jgi:outer membrane protein assembly factor BamD
MGNFSDAATKYQEFVKAHPTHEDAHYASYRRGLSYYEMAPSDLFIMPPAHERDLAAIRDARVAFSSFFANFKESPWRERAMEIFGEVENLLVRHEIYVAGFYLSRDDRNAAAVRLEGIQNEYPDSSLVPDAMFMQAVTFLEMDKVDEARRVFGAIIKHYPDHHQSKRARKYLRYLKHKSGNSKRGENG